MFSQKKIFITQHLGLGDAIICQAIVKLYSERYDKLYIPVDKRFIESISKIYQQYPRVQLVPLDNHNNQGYQQINARINNSNCEVLKLGFFSPLYTNIVHKFKTLNSTFYVPAKIQQQKQWEIPVVERDSERQKQLFEMYDVIQNQYVLIIQDRQRLNQKNIPMIINRTHILNSNLEIVELQLKTNNIFDNCYLLENAKQIHLYDTAVTHVLDQCCDMNKGTKIFNHKYIRPQQKRVVNVYKHNFIDIW